MIKHSIFIILFFTLKIEISIAQTLIPVTWNILSNVDQIRDYSLSQNKWVNKGVFSPEIKNLENKFIRIEGYIIPSDITGNRYILSSQPFSSCFFCGGAGKETVMELELQRQYLFTTDDVQVFQGKLSIKNSPHELYYTLQEAELFDENTGIFFED